MRDLPRRRAAPDPRTNSSRAAEIGALVTNLPGWYDVDDAASLAMLRSELAGDPPAFAHGLIGAKAPATRAHFASRDAAIPATAR